MANPYEIVFYRTKSNKSSFIQFNLIQRGTGIEDPILGYHEVRNSLFQLN
jgi:hypothetical protein